MMDKIHLLRKIEWNTREVVAYCFDYSEQFKNWLNGTYCLHFSESFYVDRVSSEYTGIDKVTLWVGPNTRQYWKRIFIANTPDAKEPTNLFIMKIPEYEMKGKINKEFITSEKLEQIKTWARKNQEAIEKYCNFNTYDTATFFQKIKPL